MNTLDEAIETSVLKGNYKNKIDGRELLLVIPDGTIKTAFFDPQYRGILDKLAYGNEGVRCSERCNLPQMNELTIMQFIREIDRVLQPSGHLFLWVDKFHLFEGIKEWIECTNFNIVDCITWDKGKIGMGYRSRRKSEYLVVLQKAPTRAKGCWTSHSIPDVWDENVLKEHPHSKPVELQRALIEATTDEGDWVLDPAAGGYSVLSACRLCNRNFIGGDIRYGENIA